MPKKRFSAEQDKSGRPMLRALHCVCRKPKPEHNGDEARQGSRVKYSSAIIVR